MKITLDLERDEARELRQHLLSMPFCDGRIALHEALNLAIENADEARWLHLEEGKIR